MSERQTLLVPNEEIVRQKEFLKLVKQNFQGNLKKYMLTTFGCQMNENDSEKLMGMMSEMGYIETDNAEEADLIIFNTCCVRENAEVKVYGKLGALKELKKEKPELIISVCGCMMQQPEVVEHVKKVYKQVDLIFGTHNLYKFPELLYTAIQENHSVIEVWESTGEIAEDMPIERKDGVKAWVTVMYGCNNFCSYCIVPYIRGRERSREIEDVVKEVTFLANEGYKEVTLLGQNVNSYGKDLGEGGTFAKLLYALDKVNGIERIRFATSHPKDLSDELIMAIKDCKKVCEHLHLPIQSGSSRVLHEMNRKYTKENYLTLVDKIRKEIPDISLTTDIIVGFPGETEEDFDETLDLMRKVRFDSAYTFLYSKRTGTPAAKSDEQVSDEVMKNRFQRLIDVQNEICKEHNDELNGQIVEVLVEGTSKHHEEIMTGRTRTNKVVNFKGGQELKSTLVKVKIAKSMTWSLDGEIVEVVQ